MKYNLKLLLSSHLTKYLSFCKLPLEERLEFIDDVINDVYVFTKNKVDREVIVFPENSYIFNTRLVIYVRKVCLMFDKNVPGNEENAEKIISGELTIREILNNKSYEINREPNKELIKKIENKKYNHDKVKKQYNSEPCRICKNKTILTEEFNGSGDEATLIKYYCDTCNYNY